MPMIEDYMQFFLAVQKNNKGKAELLLNKGLNINSSFTVKGKLMTALEMALEANNTEMAQWIQNQERIRNENDA